MLAFFVQILPYTVWQKKQNSSTKSSKKKQRSLLLKYLLYMHKRENFLKLLQNLNHSLKNIFYTDKEAIMLEEYWNLESMAA